MTKQPFALREARRGTVLVIVMVLLLVASAIAGAVMRSSLLDARQLVTDRQALQADRLAEAGLARAAARLTADRTYAGEAWSPELPGGEQGSVVIRILDAGGRRTMEAVATFPSGTERSVRSRRSVTLTAQDEFSNSAANQPAG